MGRQASVETRFRERVLAARKDREWSQADVSKMLRAKGIDSMYPTTVAKIESGERAVRIDEASALADLYGVSVDWLLGRDIGPQQDLVFTLQAASQTAQQAAPLVTSIERGLRERVAELRAFEFDERDAITAEYERAAAALAQAAAAFAKLWWPLRDAILAATTSEVLKAHIAEASDEATET
jgi:transcriptional regulator with XRE-family HTH domain